MSPTEPSASLWAWLQEHQLHGYLRVFATDTWADVEVAPSTIHLEEITAEAIRAHLDLPNSDIKEMEILNHERIMAYFGENSTKYKTYNTMGGQLELFKEFSVLFMMVTMLHQSPYAMLRARAVYSSRNSKAIELTWRNRQRRASYRR